MESNHSLSSVFRLPLESRTTTLCLISQVRSSPLPGYSTLWGLWRQMKYLLQAKVCGSYVRVDQDLFGWTFESDTTVLQNISAVAEAQGIPNILLNQKNGCPLRSDLRNRSKYRLNQNGGQPQRGFI